MMKIKLKTLALIICIFGLLFAGCDDDSSDSNGPGVVHVSGLITADTTWTNDNIYVIDQSVAIEDATLTIQEGTIIKIAKNEGSIISQPIIVREDTGKVKAVGTSAAHIIFTSFADDSKGGDTDRVAESPAKGDWGHVFINAAKDEAVSEFVYCDFYYGGAGDYEDSAMLDIKFAPAEINNCTFAHSAHSGLDVQDADKNSTVTNNIFFDNSKPLWMNPDFTIDGSNKFYNPAEPSVANAYNGIWLQDSVCIISNRSWGDNGVPYVSNYGFSIADDVTLTLSDSVIIKFIQTSSGIVFTDSGTGQVSNFEKAVFTSYKDDEHGGDTNFDDANSTPADGDWGGFVWELPDFHSKEEEWEAAFNVFYEDNQ